MTPGDAEARLRAALAANAAQRAALQRQHDEVVAASQTSNADDEHDPEGSTIAFERAQVAALLELAGRTGEGLARALDRLERGTYGVCGSCGGPIAAGRLQARPDTTTCIACAASARR